MHLITREQLEMRAAFINYLKGETDNVEAFRDAFDELSEEQRLRWLAKAQGEFLNIVWKVKVSEAERYRNRFLVFAAPGNTALEYLSRYFEVYLTVCKIVRRLQADCNVSPKALTVFLPQFYQEALYHLEGAQSTSEEPARTLIRAKIYSAFDRSKASVLFNKALQGAGDLIIALYFDKGANTFFAENEVAGSVQEFPLDTDLSSADPRLLGESKTTLVYSVDTRFLRIYGPLLAWNSVHLSDFHFHLVLVGESEDLHAEWESFTTLRRQVALFSRINIPSNLTRSFSLKPNSVPEITTFAACARYIHAPDLMERIGTNLLVLDVDMSIDKLPHDFINSISRKMMSAPVSPTMVALSPWRRYMAGTVFFSRQRSMDRARSISDYIKTGIGRKGAWFVDQNALTFGLERGEPLIQSLDFIDANSLQRAFQSKPVFKFFEGNVKRAGW